MNADELANQAAAKVREVIADAERRAEEIVREAEAEAARIRDDGQAGDEPEPPAAPPAQAAPETPIDPPEPNREPTESTELQGARLIALKMAMDGADREAVATHLADEHGIADSDALLDDVFARVSL
jgi:hypothetical protein